MKRKKSKAKKISVRVKEVMALTSLGKNSVYDAMNSGALPAHKIDGSTVILYSDVKAWIKNSPLYKSPKASGEIIPPAYNDEAAQQSSISGNVNLPVILAMEQESGEDLQISLPF